MREDEYGLFSQDNGAGFAPKGMQQAIQLGALKVNGNIPNLDKLSLGTPTSTPTNLAPQGLTYTPLANPYKTFNPAARSATFAKYGAGLTGPAATDVQQAATNDVLQAQATNFERGVDFDTSERGRQYNVEKFNQGFGLEQLQQQNRFNQADNARTAEMWGTFIKLMPYLAAAAKSVGGGK